MERRSFISGEAAAVATAFTAKYMVFPTEAADQTVPEGQVRPVFMHPMWIPFADDSGGNFLGIDLAPDVEGLPGQVINVGADAPFSVNQLATVVGKELGATPKLKHLPPRNEVQHAYCDHAKARRCSVRMPLLRDGEDVAVVVGVDDAKHGDLGHAARLVERPAGGAVDQPLVRHVLQQGLEQDLVLAREAERPRDLALPRGLVGRRDEVDDLLAAGQAGSFAFCHVRSSLRGA